MEYNYAEHRDWVFSEEGVDQLLTIMERLDEQLQMSGAARMDKLIVGSDPWQTFACVDYLIERGHIKEITLTTSKSQHRVFVAR